MRPVARDAEARSRRCLLPVGLGEIVAELRAVALVEDTVADQALQLPLPCLARDRVSERILPRQ